MASGLVLGAAGLGLLLTSAPAAWLCVADAPGRSATDLDGQPVTVRDTVLRARRT